MGCRNTEEGFVKLLKMLNLLDIYCNKITELEMISFL